MHHKRFNIDGRLPACVSFTHPAKGLVDRYTFTLRPAQHASKMPKPLLSVGIERSEPPVGAVTLTWSEGQLNGVIGTVELPRCQWALRALADVDWSIQMLQFTAKPQGVSDRPLCSVQPAPKLPAIPPGAANAARVQWLLSGHTPRPKSCAAKL